MTFSPLATEQLEARPDRLVQAARDLANETGSAAFTVAQVTGQAELSLKSFYRCFRSKDELLLALLAADSKLGADFLARRMADRRGTNRIRAYIGELFDMLALPGALGYAGVLVREYMRLSEHYGDELNDALAPLIDLLARQIDSPHSRRDAMTVFGVLLGGIHGVVVGGVADTRELAEYLYEFCTNGVSGR